MKNVSIPAERPALLARSLTLMKPITWFAPMWAFLCGAIASGAAFWEFPEIGRLLLGIVMAGPILCGVSQTLNDYFDREIDAINEPNRLIPAGLVSTQQVMLTIAVLLVLGLGIALYLGLGVLIIASVGLLLAVAYSAPPLRAKRNGWVGNTVVAISYEGLAWLAGHVAFGSLTEASVVVAILYSFGAHGIMSINDYKSIDGDRRGGIRTIPAMYGPKRAAWLIVATMNLAQIGVIAAFLFWGQWIAAVVIVGVMLVQLPLQRRFIQQPVAYYLKFSAIGVTFYVWGMIFAAVGLRAV
ncbi:MAG: chlorophyll synthase ChlG [Chloroflexi bacterium]|nr:chlorophyll synthase ChlG [Chloroflexota bacterium]